MAIDNLTEYGQVVAVTGDTAHVKFVRSSACGRCKACGMLAGQNEIMVQVTNEFGASVGDSVAVTIRMRRALHASALAYAFPLLMLVLGVFVGWLLSEQWYVFEQADIAMALFALIFAVLSFFLLKAAAPLYNKSVGNVYRMTEVKRVIKSEKVE